MTILNLKDSLNDSFKNVKPKREEIDKFKHNLILLLNLVYKENKSNESEEHHKINLIKFLNDTYYGDKFFINTKNRSDLVIHNGDSNSSVGVIIETKAPGSKEMITKDNLSNKSMSQLILYYFRERFNKVKPNIEIKHLIITDFNEWFIFDAKVFEEHFAEKPNLVKLFEDFERGSLPKTNTPFFYDKIATPFIEAVSKQVKFTYFNIQNYNIALRNENKKDDNILIELYKILSPEHLLKLPFANDSNSLDKRFYTELLHIIGLTETKDGSKKLIGRKKEGERNTGSILEDTIIQLDSLNKIRNLKNPKQYGKDYEEQLFNIALELSITWINRVLFLKLLEAQLISFNGNKEYAFLNINKIKNYDDLNSLFFQVLAIQTDKRNEDVKKHFSKVPYLNSSLFESTDLESSMLHISNLKDDKTLPILSTTVLKDNDKKRTGSENTLKYLFQFLDAYDFSSDGAGEIQEENKTLINASVLGLIFEKINGYKDGSFFTPGFITMYMCRETIRRAVVQKFNEVKGWACKDITEVYNKDINLSEANQIVNSIKICDPAVGSGHFLVSALNEIISVKNDLKILLDSNGKRLKEYEVKVENDELIVKDEDNEHFKYKFSNSESLRVQKALFHEKQTIIENCLFGVDINPNSVKICRLRLWIELLKNAYYKNESELETLPNIDINIKCGNSLVSRIKLDEDLKPHLASKNIDIAKYRSSINSYRNSTSKEEKWQMEEIIFKVKEDIKVEISANDFNQQRLRKVEKKLYQEPILYSQKEIDQWNKTIENLKIERNNLLVEIEKKENNPIFQNAFEWRFEFPEVLNDYGDFIGFDVVIGNPPYMSYYSRESVNISFDLEVFLRKNYEFLVNENSKTRVNSVMFFYEIGFKILRSNGILNYIVDFNLLEFPFVAIRKYIYHNWSIEKINIDLKVFEDVGSGQVISFFKAINERKDFILEKGLSGEQRLIEIQSINKSNYSFTPSVHQILLDKISNRKRLLEDCLELITGVAVNATEIGKKQFIFTNKHSENSYPLLEGGNSISSSYCYPKYSKYLLYDKSLEKKLNDQFDKDYFFSKGSHQRPFNIRKIEEFNRPKLFVRQSDSKVTATYCEKLYFGNYSLFTLYHLDNNIDLLKAYLGVLNSKLITFYALKKEIILLKKGKTPQLRSGQRGPIGIRQLPLPDLNQKTIKKLVSLVNALLENNKNNNLDDSLELEQQIDKIVYELYELTEEEIAIVEGGE